MEETTPLVFWGLGLNRNEIDFASNVIMPREVGIDMTDHLRLCEELG